MIALVLALFAVAWLLDLSLTSLSPPTDNIEQLNWVHALAWGYYKHPPLPTWLFWLPVRLFGANAWTSYAMAVAVNLASLGMLWHLLQGLRGPRHATLALLAVMCVSYYNNRIYCYNHNTVLMLVSTACASLSWRAVRTGRLHWWLALGAALGLGALTKYQIAVTGACVLSFWLSQRGWRDPAQRRGLLLAIGVALLVFAPHLQWLRAHDFAPVAYALESSLGASLDAGDRVLDAGNWLADQLLNRSLIAWMLLGLMARCGGVRPQAQGATRDPARGLILSWGLVPLVFMPAVGLLAGSRLHMPWGSPFLLFAIPAAMELFDGRVAWRRVPLKSALGLFASAQVLLLMVAHLSSPLGPSRLRDQHWRAFDSAALEQALEPALRQQLAGKPLCVIAGPGALAGAVALHRPEHPLVLIDGRYDQSPWVDRRAAADCPVLEFHQDAPQPGDAALGPQFPGISWQLRWPRSAAAG